MRILRQFGEQTFFALTLTLLLAGVLAFAGSAGAAAAVLWSTAALLGLGAAVLWMIQSLAQHQFGVDVIAVLALVGALAVGEPFAAAVISVMLATGRLLDARAAARARRDLSLLVARAPQSARLVQGDQVVQVPVGEVVRGQRLLVGPGEVVPVDGRLMSAAVVDESSLSGEPLPVDRPAGDAIRSGGVNAGPSFELIATCLASESAYSRIVTLVEQAQASSAPFVRMADRVAIVFVPVTVVLAAAAWALSGDPVRAVAVLVVATPCPLLLAAPIAVMSGLSRASRVGVIIKGGGALERLARGKTLVFDKTGTLTRGQPTVVAMQLHAPDLDDSDLLRLSASVDQVSPHVLAGAIVRAAKQRGIPLTMPTAVEEKAGYGIQGMVDSLAVRVGKQAWIVGDRPPSWVRQVQRRASLECSLSVFVGVDGEPVGAFLLEDPIRADAPRMMRAMRDAGITRTVLVTGDRADVAESVGRIVGVDTVLADRDPSDKLDVVLSEASLAPTIMVGDGVNDAPALAAADVGVALASRGSTASSEAADVVLTDDRIDGLIQALTIARRSHSIARQSVGVGMGLSAVAMVAAAMGMLPPAAGALLQEVIDIVAILLALRAVLPGPVAVRRISGADAELTAKMLAEHTEVAPIVEQVRGVADALRSEQRSLLPVRELLVRLDEQLLPHEHAEEAQLFPVVSRLLGGAEFIGGLSRTHAEIDHQAGRMRRLVESIGSTEPDAEDLLELRALLYGLYAILRLHNAQEEETIYSLLDGKQVAVSVR